MLDDIVLLSSQKVLYSLTTHSSAPEKTHHIDNLASELALVQLIRLPCYAKKMTNWQRKRPAACSFFGSHPHFQVPKKNQPLTSSSSSSSISSSGGRVDTGPAEGESSSIAAMSPLSRLLSWCLNRCVYGEQVDRKQAKAYGYLRVLLMSYTQLSFKLKPGGVHPFHDGLRSLWAKREAGDGSRAGVKLYFTKK